jgi:hypothetical protein
MATWLDEISTVPASMRGANCRWAAGGIVEHRRALDLGTEPDEEPRHRVEVRDGDTDMVETSYL